MDLSIRVEHLKKTFGNTEALRGLTIGIEGPQVFGIVGPDGAGKTTLLRILAGLIRRDAGSVSVLGLDPERQAMALKPLLGYVPQTFSMYPTLTVDENLLFVARCHRVADFAARRRELLALARLEAFAGARCETLSGGMKQKVALCGALLPRPPLIILDEPTTGVDVVARAEFWDTIKEQAKHALVLVATNYLDEAERCDRMLYLVGGLAVAIGTPREVRQSAPVYVFNVVTTPRSLEVDLDVALSKDERVDRVAPTPNGVRVETRLAGHQLAEAIRALGFADGKFVIEDLEPDLETALLALETRARLARPSDERTLLKESWWSK